MADKLAKLFTILDSKEHGAVKPSDVKVTIDDDGLVTITFHLPKVKEKGDKLPKIDLEVGKNLSHKPDKLGARISWKEQEEEATLEIRTTLAARKRDNEG